MTKSNLTQFICCSIDFTGEIISAGLLETYSIYIWSLNEKFKISKKINVRNRRVEINSNESKIKKELKTIYPYKRIEDAIKIADTYVEKTKNKKKMIY